MDFKLNDFITELGDTLVLRHLCIELPLLAEIICMTGAEDDFALAEFIPLPRKRRCHLRCNEEGMSMTNSKAGMNSTDGSAGWLSEIERDLFFIGVKIVGYYDAAFVQDAQF